MTARGLAAALWLAAALIYAGFVRPSDDRMRATARELERLQGQQREGRARLVDLEKRDAARTRAASLLSGVTPTTADAVGVLRRSVLESLGASPVSGARLQVRAGRAAVAALVHLSAEGSFADMVSLAGRVARPGTGIVLERVELRPSNAGATLDLDAARLGAQP